MKLIKDIKSIIFYFIIASYLTLSLVSINNCSTTDDSTNDYLKKQKRSIFVKLQKDFNADEFNCNAANLLTKTIILDSTLLKINKNPSSGFIKAEINTGCNKKYFTKLNCSKEIIEQIEKFKTNNIYLVAKFNRIDNSSMLVNADSLDGTAQQFDLGENIILTGTCIAAAEIPSFENVN